MAFFSDDDLGFFEAANGWMEIHNIEGFEKIYKEYSRLVYQSSDSSGVTADCLVADKTMGIMRGNNRHIK